MINIYIPTAGRVDRQKTLERLPPKIAKNVVLVCPPDEVKEHVRLGRNAVGCKANGITLTRDFILDHAARKGQKYVLMLDDDLVFQIRRKNGRIENSTPDEVDAALAWMEKQFKEGLAHASFGARFLGYNNPSPMLEPGRAMYALGYNVPIVKRVGAKFGKGLEWNSTMEDFNITLQLITKGYTNRVSLLYRITPGPSNAKGGCSRWRTTARQTDSAKRLAKMFPDIVKIRPKKEWQGMDEGMMDVTVYWQKALKLSKAA